MIKVSIQGQANSFHDIATKQFFDSPQIITCETFRETIDCLVEQRSDYAVVAIENSLYGTINEVYDLILKNHVEIVGEIYLRIVQNLIGTSDSTIADIKEIHSHPVALAQCEEFLDKNLPEAIRYEHHDTAGSVVDIKKINKKSIAAIASAESATENNMKILAKSIETNKQNYTRFVILGNKNNAAEDYDKTSLVVQTSKDTKAGSLLNILRIFADNNINMTALHSRPVVGKAWHYMFYIDIEIDNKSNTYKKVFKELDEIDCKYTILGNYKSGLE